MNKILVKCDVVDGYKNCSKCMISLTICNFNVNKKLKTGLSSWCKKCQNQKSKNRRDGKRPPKELLSEGLKRCSKCSKIKEESNKFFNKSAKGINGLSGDCRACRSEYGKEYRVLNPEKVRDTQKASYKKYIKKRKIYMKKMGKK